MSADVALKRKLLAAVTQMVSINNPSELHIALVIVLLEDFINGGGDEVIHISLIPEERP